MLVCNIHAAEPNISFIKKINRFFADPENKKMVLNMFTGAACATGVSLAVVYRHELAQLLWGNGYHDPFVNPIMIGNYACKGLEKVYKNVVIKQIRVSPQSGAQCGLNALVSATAWIDGDNQKYVTFMQDHAMVNNVVHTYLNQNEKTKELKGQWVGDTELMQLYTLLKTEKKINDNRMGNNIIVFIADKADLANEIKPDYLYKEIKETFKKDGENETPFYCSFVVGSMRRELSSEEKREKQFSETKQCDFEMPFGHWYTINIAVKAGTIEVVVTDPLNSDRTNDKAVQMVIDSLLE